MIKPWPGLAIAFWLTLAAGASAVQAPGWLQPEVVPGTIDPKRPAESAVRVRVTLLPDGRAVALTTDGITVVELAERARSGNWRSERATVPSTARVRPTIANGPGGTLVAAWRTPTGEVRTQDRDTRGRWLASQVMATGASAGATIAVGAAGDAVAAWIEGGTVRARTRQSGVEDWSQAASISDGSTQVALDPSGANVDPAGTATVAWSELSAEGPAGVPNAAIKSARDDAWAAPQPLPGHPSGPAGAPVLNGDSAGTVTAVWTSRQGVTSAIRTAASRSWVADTRPAVTTNADSVQLASAVDVNGRAVLLTAERSDATARWRVLSRDGAAESWTAIGTPSDASTDRLGPLAVGVTRTGDALVVIGRRGAGCFVDVARVTAGRSVIGENGQVAAGCDAVTLSTDALGNALISGVMSGRGGTQIRTALRPTEGLNLTVGGVTVAPLRILVQTRLSARARITMTLVRAGAGKRAVTRDGGPGTTPVAIGTAGLPAGRYTLVARAQSGALVSRPVRIPLRLTK